MAMFKQTTYGIREPPRKKQRICAGVSKFQGKWDTNLGILHINGNRGYYGVNMSNCTIAEKFIENISANFDGTRIRGRWHWASNDQTYGRFELNLEPSNRYFSGTWGWHRRCKGGGLWKGKRLHSMLPVKRAEVATEPVVENNAYATGMYQKGQVEQVNNNQAMLDYVRRMTARVKYTYSPTDNAQPGGGTKPDPIISEVCSERKDDGPPVQDTKLQSDNSVCMQHRLLNKTKPDDEPGLALHNLGKVSSSESAAMFVNNAAQDSSIFTGATHQSAIALSSEQSSSNNNPAELLLEPEFEPEWGSERDGICKPPFDAPLPAVRDSTGERSDFLDAKSKEEQKVDATNESNSSKTKLKDFEQTKTKGKRSQERDSVRDSACEDLLMLSKSDHWSVFSM